MTRLAVIVMFGLTGQAVAQDCDWIARFVAGDAPPDEAACADGVCVWQFAYRHSEARDFFERSSAELAGCLGPQVGQGDQVNHPDSYELRQFGAMGGTVYLSIKDKAALEQTFVFLRTDPSNADGGHP